MLNIFKVKIPKNNAQEVTELESYTVEWEVRAGNYGDTAKFYKVFINTKEAEEFKKQLEECAKFINCWIKTKLYKN